MSASRTHATANDPCPLLALSGHQAARQLFKEEDNVLRRAKNTNQMAPTRYLPGPQQTVPIITLPHMRRPFARKLAVPVVGGEAAFVGTER